MTQPQELNVFTCELNGINQIEASAGTGKTWNICALYLRLLLEQQLPVQQILVVTFTNAATAELRERIRSRIVEMLRYLSASSAAPADPFVSTLVTTMQARDLSRTSMRLLLELALQTFDEAAIFTIHGFCQRALADAPFAAGMPFASELVADDGDLRLQAVHDFWRRHISGGAIDGELATYLVKCKDSPDRFATLLKRHVQKSQSTLLWPDDIDAAFVSNKVQLDQAYTQAAASWRANGTDIRALMLASLEALKKNIVNAESVEAACKDWDNYADGGEPLDMLDFSACKLALFSTGKLKTSTKNGQAVPQHAFFHLAEDLFSLRGPAVAGLDLARLRLIRDLLRDCSAALREHKRELRIVSYDDILYNVFAELQSPVTPWLASALLKRYPAALIDEFQDTDPLQFSIFNTIYGAGSHPLFFVGDPKQAIYSFRNADLHTYLLAKQKATSQYSLAENQRSSAGLIAAQNALFGCNPAAFILPGLDYQPVRFGKKPRAVFHDDSGANAPLQIWTLHDGADLPETSVAKKLAETATAAEIARLLDAAQAGKVRLGERALQAGDIAVLVKSHAQGSAIRHALAALNIGSVELSQANVFDSVDAAEVERLLQAIMAPSRTGLLLAALATELLGLEARDIDAIAQDEPALRVRMETFNHYRDLWQERGIGFMYRRLLTMEDVSKRMLARSDGERRMTNLLHLGEYLHKAGAEHPSPDALLRWFNSQRRHQDGDEAAQLRLESDQNLVQIVTIHRSKGLEYPVVFCPFLWSGNLAAGGDKPEGHEYHDHAGNNVIDLRLQPDDIDDIKRSIRQETSAEFLRLVYVALTRAAHRCYLVAGCYGKKTSNGISDSESRRSMLNWLVAGAGTAASAWSEHKITVDAIDQAWSTFALQHAPHVGIAAIPKDNGTPVQFMRPGADSLAPQPLPAPLEDGWRMTSFSALKHATSGEAGASDHDRRAAYSGIRRDAMPAALAGDDILRFPRGSGAGDTLHAILEAIDFSDPTRWDRAIDAGLASHPQALPGIPKEQQLPLLRGMVRNMLAMVTGTVLANGIRLADVSASRCMAELEFNLPAARLRPDVFNALLANAGYAVPDLQFKHMHGYLKGYIDLVFESSERYYLLDWKSNHLGYCAADYGNDGMQSAMAEHGYHLQYLLYAVALHRHLMRRVPGYAYETHFGGVLYLFIRGVRPDWQDTDGKPSGVYFHKPAFSIIAALEALLIALPARKAA